LVEVEAFLKQHPDVQAYLVDVRAQRPLSQTIAMRSGVRHESPQVIVFRQGVPTWNASHADITADALKQHIPAS
jgi:bacillithiol system protein YtxJ